MKNSFGTPLVVEVMPSGKKFKLHYDFTYNWKGLDDSAVKITVKKGFVTDFASIPQPFHSFLSKLGLYTKASIPHDAIYQKHYIATDTSGQHYYIFDRYQADVVFRDAMRDWGVKEWKVKLMYAGVRMFGWLAWHKKRG